jgi:hypothetical protein
MREEARMAEPQRRRSAPALARSERASAAGAFLALQRLAGNSAATQLAEAATKSDIDLELPGVGDHIAVDAFSLETGRHGEVVGVTLTRHVDANSPGFMRAAATGEPGTRAVLVANKPGAAHRLILSLEACIVTSYSPSGDSETVGLSFTRADFEQ